MNPCAWVTLTCYAIPYLSNPPNCAVDYFFYLSIFQSIYIWILFCPYNDFRPHWTFLFGWPWPDIPYLSNSPQYNHLHFHPNIYLSIPTYLSLNCSIYRWFLYKINSLRPSDPNLCCHPHINPIQHTAHIIMLTFSFSILCYIQPSPLLLYSELCSLYPSYSSSPEGSPKPVSPHSCDATSGPSTYTNQPFSTILQPLHLHRHQHFSSILLLPTSTSTYTYQTFSTILYYIQEGPSPFSIHANPFLHILYYIFYLSFYTIFFIL